MHYQLLLWAINELGLAIFAASAAALRPLLKRYSKFWGSSHGHSDDKSHGSNHDPTGPFHLFDMKSHDKNRRITQQRSREEAEAAEQESWTEAEKGWSNEGLVRVHESRV